MAAFTRQRGGITLAGNSWGATVSGNEAIRDIMHREIRTWPLAFKTDALSFRHRATLPVKFLPP